MIAPRLLNVPYLLAPALQIAIATRRTVYDSLYLALVIDLNTTI